jgi:hypothetical protein
MALRAILRIESRPNHSGDAAAQAPNPACGTFAQVGIRAQGRLRIAKSGFGRVSNSSSRPANVGDPGLRQPLLPRILHGPGQGVVGDLLPALHGGQQVRIAGAFLDFGHGVGLLVLGVGALDAGGIGGVAHQDRGRCSPPITSVRWSMTAGTVRFSIGVGVGIQGLDLDLETWVARGEYAVALLLVVSLPLLPAARGYPEAVD